MHRQPRFLSIVSTLVAAMTDASPATSLALAALDHLRAALSGDWQVGVFNAVGAILAASRSGVDLRGSAAAEQIMLASDALSLRLSSCGDADEGVVFGIGAAGSLLEFLGDELHDERVAHAEILFARLCISLRCRQISASGHRLERSVRSRISLVTGSTISEALH